MQNETILTWLDMDEPLIAKSLVNEPKFRAKQIFEQLHKGKTIEQMPNLPKNLKEKMQEIPLGGVEIISTLTSKIDGTKKYLFKLRDGNVVEGVFMRYTHGNTLCISTQVGCRMNCSFCASTIGSLVRNLSPGEMIGQVLAAQNDNLDVLTDSSLKRAVTNVVLMGSGEPLDNYDNTVAFLNLLKAPNGLNISMRNVSLSTCGIVDKIDELAKTQLCPTLSLSLHAPFDDMRQELMPIAKKYPIWQTISAVKRYVAKTGRRATFEYALIEGVNDTDECIETLGKLLSGFQCHVNLIPLNPVEESTLVGTARKTAHKIALRLESENNISTTVRREMGADINGACGQLRRSYIEKNED